MLLTKNLPTWISIITIILALIVVFLTIWQATLYLGAIHQISVEIAESSKDIPRANITKTSNQYLEVISPIFNQEIESPIEVSGRSNFFEANTRIRIKDNNNKILADTFTMAQGWMGELHPFSKDVSYETPSTGKGVVEIFEESAKDGSEINKITIPVFFGDFPELKQTAFCGWSTNSQCSSDFDCMTGGCSGQVCQSKSEEPIITTCEYTECYNSSEYGVVCGCINNKCQWH